MKKIIESFEDLECWKACTELRRYVHTLLKSYPKEEKYALADDMKRSSRSTTHNIAEGFGRYHYQENIQFCRQSRGSLCELIDQLITSLDEGFITEEQCQRARAMAGNSLRLLNGYINYLSRRKKESSY